MRSQVDFIPSDLEVESDRASIIKICSSNGALDVLVNNRRLLERASWMGGQCLFRIRIESLASSF